MSRSSVNVPQNFFDDKKNECNYVELKGYLEKKFEGAGIEKLNPESEKDVEIEAKDIQQKYKDKLIEKAKEFLADRIEIQITIKDTSDIAQDENLISEDIRDNPDLPEELSNVRIAEDYDTDKWYFLNRTDFKKVTEPAPDKGKE